MNSDLSYAFWFGFWFGFGIGAISIFMVLSVFYTYTPFYKQGQIDALTGKVVFELKKQPDETTQWKRIEK